MVCNLFIVALCTFVAKILTLQLFGRGLLVIQRSWPIFALSSSILEVVNGSFYDIYSGINFNLL